MCALCLSLSIRLPTAADLPPYRSPSDRPGLSKTHIFWVILNAHKHYFW
jgi:hypothetical protein